MLADLHTHTNTSHGHHSAAEMYEGAAAAGLDLFGLSEHSPLPEEYACKLYVAAFPGNFRQFVQDVQALRQRELEREDRPLPLLGVELDWLPDYPRHMCRFLSCWPFSYVIGSLHYVGLFPVARPNTWTDGREAAYARYREYYEEMARMAASGLVNVASHPDFIKRASYDLFHAWLREEGSLDVVAGAVQAMADNGVIMEVSSAGLRQPFAEPYPCPAIMRLAADFGVDVCLASDAHDKADVGAGLADVARYARSFGFRFDTLPLRPDDIATRPAVLAQALELTDFLDSRTHSLPLGQKQRLALLCATLHEPPVLFLDEPTSGVDARTRRDFWKHITAMTEAGASVLVTTHFMEEAEYCDRMALIYRGAMISMGTPDELKASCRGLPGVPDDPTLEDAFIASIRRYDAEHPQ